MVEVVQDAEGGAEFWACHPHLRGRSPADLKHCLPLVIHEDAVPISKHQSAYVRSWSSILGMGKETDAKFMICSYVKGGDVENLDRSWPMVLASFDSLVTPHTWYLGWHSSVRHR